MNAISREKKEEQIAKLKENLADSGFVVVAQQTGMTPPQQEDVRAKLGEVNATYQVIKNNLAKIAIAETRNEGLTPLFAGQTGIVFAEDAVGAAKAIQDLLKEYKKENKWEILGGALEGQVLDPAGITSVASMPSLDESRAQIAGMLKSAPLRIARGAKAPISKLGRAIKLAFVEPKEKEGEPATAEA
jgi:large subunit ribosomal protein L10